MRVPGGPGRASPEAACEKGTRIRQVWNLAVLWAPFVAPHNLASLELSNKINRHPRLAVILTLNLKVPVAEASVGRVGSKAGERVKLSEYIIGNEPLVL